MAAVIMAGMHEIHALRLYLDMKEKEMAKENHRARWRRHCHHSLPITNPAILNPFEHVSSHMYITAEPFLHHTASSKDPVIGGDSGTGGREVG